MDKKYTEINSEVIDKWIKDGWEWGQPISHEVFKKAHIPQKIISRKFSF